MMTNWTFLHSTEQAHLNNDISFEVELDRPDRYQQV